MVPPPVRWQGEDYAREAEPQRRWGRQLLASYPWRGDERVLDVGCGPGTLTRELTQHVPRGRITAIDVDPSMVEQARDHLAGVADVWQEDILRFRPPGRFDVVFSNAVLHWVLDHDVLFQRLFELLRPGGALVAQCGGKGNVDREYEVAAAVAARPEFAPHFQGFQPTWYFSDAEAAKRRMEAAGFSAVAASLERSPVEFADAAAYARFARAAPLRPFLSRLPTELHDGFCTAFQSTCGPDADGVWRMGYVRLNLNGRRAG